jgi:hypothetical protein
MFILYEFCVPEAKIRLKIWSKKMQTHPFLKQKDQHTKPG